MIALMVIVAVVICVLAEKHRMQVFNERDKSGDYRTTQQRMWNND